jgi:undecaprenyl diphosphate synthase
MDHVMDHVTKVAQPIAHATAVGLDSSRLPRHVAIIMDGNGRWAKSRTWDRTRGHQQGAEVVRSITTESVKLGIARLTLYAFSSENWSRPPTEIDFLMELLDRFLNNELPTLQENDVRLEAIGSLQRLPLKVRKTLDRIINATAQNKSMVLCLALSYGGRDELTDACRAIAREVQAGRIAPEEITPQTIQSHLYAPHAHDVDVVIRTAGEQRMSNFLPWEATYAEFISVAPLWPDFGIAAYHAALQEFQRRERRFGGV